MTWINIIQMSVAFLLLISLVVFFGISMLMARIELAFAFAVMFIFASISTYSMLYSGRDSCQHKYGHWFAKSQYTVAAHVCKKCGYEEQADIDSVELSKLKAEETK